MYYREFHEQVASGDPQARALNRMLEVTGVRICQAGKHSTHVKPNETYAVSVINMLRRRHGERVVGTALRLLVGMNQSGALGQDTIKAMTEIVRTFPHWIADEPTTAAALAGINLERLRAEARALGTPCALFGLLTHALALRLGRGR